MTKPYEIPQEVLDFCKTYKRNPKKIIIDQTDGMLIYTGNFIFKKGVPREVLHFKEIRGYLKVLEASFAGRLVNLRNIRRIGKYADISRKYHMINGPDLQCFQNLEYVGWKIYLWGGYSINGLNPYIESSNEIFIHPKSAFDKFLIYKKSKILQNISKNLTEE